MSTEQQRERTQSYWEPTREKWSHVLCHILCTTTVKSNIVTKIYTSIVSFVCKPFLYSTWAVILNTFLHICLSVSYVIGSPWKKSLFSWAPDIMYAYHTIYYSYILCAFLEVCELDSSSVYGTYMHTCIKISPTKMPYSDQLEVTAADITDRGSDIPAVCLFFITSD